MNRIRDFIMSGGVLSEVELGTTIRERLATMREGEQKDWLRQVELSFDGYGGARQVSAIQKVRAVLLLIETEMSTASAASG